MRWIKERIKGFVVGAAITALFGFAGVALAGLPVTPIVAGGTGTSTAPTYGKVYVGGAGGNIEYVSTSSLGLKTTDVAEGTNQYFTNTRAQNAISLTTTGSGAASYTGGTLNIPTPPSTAASTTLLSDNNTFSGANTFTGANVFAAITANSFNTILYVPAPGNYNATTCGGVATTTYQGCVQSLYASASTSATKGATIVNTYSATGTAPILFNINGLAINFVCSAGVHIGYTGPSGSIAITINNGNPVGHPQSIFGTNCDFLGTSNGAPIVAGQANTATTTGLLCGGTNGCVGVQLQGSWNGYGTQVEYGANSYMDSWEGVSLSGGNGGINNNGSVGSNRGSLATFDPASNSGERFVGHNVTLTDPGNSTSSDAVVFATSSVASAAIDGISMDDVQIYIAPSNGSIAIGGTVCHIENSDYSQYGAYWPIWAASSQATSLSLKNCEIANDANSSATTFPGIVKHGVNFTWDTIHIDNYGGQTIAIFSDHSLNNGSSSDHGGSIQVQGGSLTNIMANQAYSQAVGAGWCEQVANSFPFCLYIDSANVVHIRDGNQDVWKVDSNGNSTFGGASGNTTLSGTLTENGTGASSFAGALSTAKTFASTLLASFNGGASTTVLSVFSTAYFGGTSTSTINSAGLFTGNASTTNLTATTAWIPNLGTAAGAFLAVDPNGKIIATTTPSGGGGGITALGNYATTTGTAISFSTTTTSFNGLTLGQTIAASANALMFTPTITGTLNNAGLTNSSMVINGTTFNLGDSKTITAASSSVLSDNNTFSGNIIFNNLITGSVSGNAATATALQNARTINGVSFNGTANIIVQAASSSALSDNNTFSGNDTFSNQITGSISGAAGSVGHSISPDGSTLTGSSFNGGSTVSNWAINLTNPNSWTGLQQFSNSTSTLATITSGWITNLRFATTTAGCLTTASSTGMVLSVPCGAVPIYGTTQARYYGAGYSNGQSLNTSTVSPNTIYALPIYISKPGYAINIGIDMENTNSCTGISMHMGIYQDSNGLPGNLLLDPGNINSQGLGTHTISIDQQLAQGQYWIAVDFSCGILIRSYPTNGLIPTLGASNGFSAASTNYAGLTYSSTFSTSTMPSSLTSPTYASSPPYPYMALEIE